MATAKQMVAKATSQVGTTEKGFSNVVKYNDWYWGKGKYGSWAAWCSVFLCWCANQVGMRKNVDYPYSAGVAVCFAWFIQKGRKVSKYSLKYGDWARFTFSHVALVLSRNGRTSITTLEGNTSPGSSGSQRDGGGVYKRVRPLGLIQYGGRPNYTGASTTPAKPATPAKPKGLFGMALKGYDEYGKNQAVSKGATKTLKTRKKSGNAMLVSLKKGELIGLTAHLRVSGLREGQVAEVWARVGEYVKSSKKGHARYDHRRITVVGRAGGGDVHVEYNLVDKNTIGPKHKGEPRLYLCIKNVSGDQCVVEDVKWTVLAD